MRGSAVAGGFLEDLRGALGVLGVKTGLEGAEAGLAEDGAEEDDDAADDAVEETDEDGVEGALEAVFRAQPSFVLHFGSKHMVKLRLPLRWTDTMGVPHDSQILLSGLISASRGNG